MNPEKWQRVKQVFDGALACESEAQSRYIEEACQGDPDVLSEVETLLHHHRQANSQFLNRRPTVPDETSPIAQADLPSSRVGRRVGVYQIQEEIGHGGMGQVFRAARVDGLYQKQVAIKFVRGGFDTTALLERFGNERQILASLDHANIARLLDGGTSEDGTPYLVMELIEGTPIDHYCREHQLGIPEKLKLFRRVCAAVQFAHQHLVIHRDIKPSNILVTTEGAPKLLDFGIAKILDPMAGSEPTQLRPMTPEYASPEQVRGNAITTATDIYSLGVVLYQVLTGQSPYALKTDSSHELAQAICEREPRKPSSIVLAHEPAKNVGQMPPAGKLRDLSAAKLRRRLSGDLDNILLKALRKEPQMRYGSVEQFSEDIRRYLEGLPVTAARGSWSYRARKFATRHKAGVAAGIAVMLSLALGFTLTLREKRIAERRFNDTRKLANSLIFEIDKAIGDLPGATAARKLLVNRALEYLDGLSKDVKGDASLERELATAYDRVGDVLGYPYAANLGDSPGALESYRKALKIRERLSAGPRADWKLQNELVGSYFRIANVLENTTDLKGALDAWEKALPIAERIASGSPSAFASDQLAGVYYFKGALLARMGDRDRALASYEQGKSIRTAALETYGQNITLRNHLAADYMGIASLIAQQGRLDEAINIETKAAQTIQQISRDHPESAAFKEYLGEAYSQLAGLEYTKVDYQSAFASSRQAHQIFTELFAADPNNHLAKANLAFSDSNMAKALLSMGKPKEAMPLLREAVVTFEDMSPEKSSDRMVRSGVAFVYFQMGNAIMAQAQAGNPEHWNLAEVREARSWYERSLNMWAQKQKLNEVMDDESGDPKLVAAAKAHTDDVLAGHVSSQK
jgi:non-specific serine/threonine protein kinase/serine/threonine-protein kinase